MAYLNQIIYCFNNNFISIKMKLSLMKIMSQLIDLCSLDLFFKIHCTISIITLSTNRGHTETVTTTTVIGIIKYVESRRTIMGSIEFPAQFSIHRKEKRSKEYTWCEICSAFFLIFEIISTKFTYYIHLVFIYKNSSVFCIIIIRLKSIEY